MTDDFRTLFRDIGKHVSTGTSYMIPVVTVGGICWALFLIFGGGEGGPIVAAFFDISSIGMSLFVPIMSAYIAYAIADRPGIAPGLICGMLATNLGTGFLGALVSGLLVGYLMFWLLKKVTIPDVVKTTWWLYAPVIAALIVGFIMIFLIGPPVKAATDALTNWLVSMSSGSVVLLGVIIGLMCGVDFGGPINKVAFLFALGALEQGQHVPMGLFMAGAACPSLGMGLATLLAPKLYSKEEKDFGKAALALGFFVGFSEGAIPFAITDLVRVMAASALGTAVAGALGGVFGLTIPAPGSGIVGMFIFNKPVLYAVATIIGSVVVALLVNLFKSVGRSKEVQPV